MRTAAFLFGLLLSSSLLAWSGEAHQLVALIAAKHLTPEAAAEVHRLLQKSELRKDLAEDLSLTDAAVVNWADQVRRERNWTADYHFVNIPLDAAAYDAKRDDPSGEHIVAAITKFEQVLADKTKSDEVRAEALLFLIHLVGDLHQPMHAVQRGNDKGGNRVRIMIPNTAPNRRKDERVSNLHELWDLWLVRAYVGDKEIAEFADALDKAVTDDDAAIWKTASVEEWADESHRIAVDHAYPGVAAEGTTKLDQRYVDEKREHVELQLKRAGVRLAHVLNSSLGK